MMDDICEVCGERNSTYAEFCTACGSYLGWDSNRRSARPDPAPTVTGQPAPPPAQPAAPGPGLGPTSSRPDRRPPETAVPRPPPPVPVPPAEPPCTRCGTPNDPQRRFCRKCGNSLRVAETRTLPRAREPKAAPWWRRLGPSGASGPSRAAYRRSLPSRYRVARVVVALVLVGLVSALLVVAGRNPITWARARWADLRGTLTPVSDVTASADPGQAVLREYQPRWAVDNVLDRAWATTWRGGGSDSRACGPIQGGGTATLRLALPDRTQLRAIEVAAGLPKDDPLRPLQWRPRMLELRFADGTCERVPLADRPEAQRVKIKLVTTDAVAVAVAAAYPPKSGQGNRVAISEIRLLRRPRVSEAPGNSD